MNFERLSLDDCEQAQDILVAIDVLRAFSCAAYAFGRGAERILLVGEVAQAFALKQRFPSARLMGEVGGLPIPGFDYGNSPTEIARQELAGCTLIQRTSAGTQGIVRSRQARLLLAGSLCCAAATARHLARVPGSTVSFVITGRTSQGHGDEDEACADYIQACLETAAPDPAPYLARVRASKTAAKFIHPTGGPVPASDLEHCLQVDRFDFALRVERQGDLLVMTPVAC